MTSTSSDQDVYLDRYVVKNEPESDSSTDSSDSDQTNRQSDSNSPSDESTSSPEKKETLFPKVAGMPELKQQLRRSIAEPLLKPEKFERMNVSTSSGVLLFGPPGCGKTFIVTQMTKALGIPVYTIKASDVGSSYIHQTSINLSKRFEKARQKAPSLIFLDEIETLAQDRSQSAENHRVEEVNELLSQIDQATDEGVIVIGSSNCPDLIDDAVIRTGRIDKHLYVPPPDQATRKALLETYVRRRPHQKSIEYAELAGRTKNYSCSDIEYVVEEAARLAVERNREGLLQKELIEIIKTTSPSVQESTLKKYRGFVAENNDSGQQKASKRVGFARD